MEHTNEVKKEKNSKEIWTKLAMTISIYILIGLFLLTVIVLIKNINEIKTDPIVYGVNKNDFLICSCYDKKGNAIDYNSEGIIPEKDYGFNLNLE